MRSTHVGVAIRIEANTPYFIGDYQWLNPLRGFLYKNLHGIGIAKGTAEPHNLEMTIPSHRPLNAKL